MAAGRITSEDIGARDLYHALADYLSLPVILTGDARQEAYKKLAELFPQASDIFRNHNFYDWVIQLVYDFPENRAVNALDTLLENTGIYLDLDKLKLITDTTYIESLNTENCGYTYKGKHFWFTPDMIYNILSKEIKGLNEQEAIDKLRLIFFHLEDRRNVEIIYDLIKWRAEHNYPANEQWRGLARFVNIRPRFKVSIAELNPKILEKELEDNASKDTIIEKYPWLSNPSVSKNISSTTYSYKGYEFEFTPEMLYNILAKETEDLNEDQAVDVLAVIFPFLDNIFTIREIYRKIKEQKRDKTWWNNLTSLANGEDPQYLILLSELTPEILEKELKNNTGCIIIEKIVKKGSKWQVQSEKGRNMGTYGTKEEAEKRLQQVHYFKHMNESIKKLDNFFITTNVYELKDKMLSYKNNSMRIFIDEKVGVYLIGDVYDTTHMEMIEVASDLYPDLDYDVDNLEQISIIYCPNGQQDTYEPDDLVEDNYFTEYDYNGFTIYSELKKNFQDFELFKILGKPIQIWDLENYFDKSKDIDESYTSSDFKLGTAGYITEDGSFIYLDEYHGEDRELEEKHYPEFSNTHAEDDTCVRIEFDNEPNEEQYKRLEEIIDIYLDNESYCKVEIWDGTPAFYKIFSLEEGACSDQSWAEKVGNWTGYKLVQMIKNFFNYSSKGSVIKEDKESEDNQKQMTLDEFIKQPNEPLSGVLSLCRLAIHSLLTQRSTVNYRYVSLPLIMRKVDRDLNAFIKSATSGQEIFNYLKLDEKSKSMLCLLAMYKEAGANTQDKYSIFAVSNNKYFNNDSLNTNFLIVWDDDGKKAPTLKEFLEDLEESSVLDDNPNAEYIAKGIWRQISSFDIQDTINYILNESVNSMKEQDVLNLDQLEEKLGKILTLEEKLKEDSDETISLKEYLSNDKALLKTVVAAEQCIMKYAVETDDGIKYIWLSELYSHMRLTFKNPSGDPIILGLGISEDLAQQFLRLKFSDSISLCLLGMYYYTDAFNHAELYSLSNNPYFNTNHITTNYLSVTDHSTKPNITMEEAIKSIELDYKTFRHPSCDFKGLWQTVDPSSLIGQIDLSESLDTDGIYSLTDLIIDLGRMPTTEEYKEFIRSCLINMYDEYKAAGYTDKEIKKEMTDVCPYDDIIDYIMDMNKEKETVIENNTKGEDKPMDEEKNIINEEKSDDIYDFIEDLYELRKESIAKEGEYGLGNLVFKEFRNLGYLDNLKELRRQEKSKELSLEKLEEVFKTHKKMTKDEFEQFKKDHEDYSFEEREMGTIIKKDDEQIGTYLSNFEQLWLDESLDSVARKMCLEEDIEDPWKEIDRDELKNFVKKYEAELNSDDYEKIYNDVKDTYSSLDLFKKLCWYVLDINILEYIGDTIPVRFFHNANITSIVIPDNIRIIEREAFFNCKQLEKVDMSKSSVTTIKSSAFENCSELKDITFPKDTLVLISNRAFAGCKSLDHMFLPDSLKHVGYDVFDGLPSNAVIELNRGVDRSDGPDDPHPKGLKAGPKSGEFLQKHLKWANA